MAKKKKPYKYLKLYHEWAASNQITARGIKCDGLCMAFIDLKMFRHFILFEPTNEDYFQLKKEGKPSLYWGKYSPDSNGDEYSGGKFSPMRRNIVLLMAAMNGEL